MDDKILDYCRVVALMAQQDVLEEKTAIHFCGSLLPQLITELEIMRRVVQQSFPVPAPAQPEEAQPEPEAPAKPKRKVARRRKVKGGKR